MLKILPEYCKIVLNTSSESEATYIEKQVTQKVLPEPYYHCLKIPIAYLEKKTCTIAFSQNTENF